jgi:hypothetical protein
MTNSAALTHYTCWCDALIEEGTEWAVAFRFRGRYFTKPELPTTPSFTELPSKKFAPKFFATARPLF